MLRLSPSSTFLVLLLAIPSSPARADDALDRGLAILRAQKSLRPDLLGEVVFRVRVADRPIGFFRTVTTADEFKGKPVYRISGQSLTDRGGYCERMEYLYLAYPDLTPVHYQRNLDTGLAGPPGARAEFLLRLEGDRFVIRSGEAQPREVEYQAGVVGFDLVTHLALIVPREEGARSAFRMIDEDGSIRRVEFEARALEPMLVGGREIQARRVSHTGLVSLDGSSMDFQLWFDGDAIVRFEAHVGEGIAVGFEPCTPEEYALSFGSPTETALEFLRALADRDGARLARRIDFRESYVVSLSKNGLNRNLSADDLEALWTAVADSYRDSVLGGLVRDGAEFAPASGASAAELRERLQALETAEGDRAVVRYAPASGAPVYLYLRRDGSGWRVAYVAGED